MIRCLEVCTEVEIEVEMELLDVHTHNAEAVGAIISVRPWQFNPKPGCVYSVGIHPWDTAALNDAEVALKPAEAEAELSQLARHPSVVAIGECGIDHLRGGSIDAQIALTEIHIRISEQVGKPLILHCVRAVNEIIALYRRYQPRQKWLIHGFRGSIGAAQALLACPGINLSYGEKFCEEAVRATPVDRLYVETDDSPLPIEEIASRVAAVKGCQVSDLLASRLFS